MPFYLLYLLKLSISLGVVWGFYQLLLRRLTFYNWNRWYLLVYSAFCFVIPLIDIRLFVKTEPSLQPLLVREFPVIWNAPVYQAPAAAVSSWDLLLVVRLLSLRRIRRRATPVDGGGRFLVYDVNKPIIPFSFGRSIYINPRLHSQEEWKEIILHEYVHVRQHHTIDILLSELLCIVCWYNPFAWLIRFSIRQNLEFIADEQVLRNGSDKIEYQYHLLKVVGVAEYRIANNFNFSSLRKRIVMMNKMKSARLQLVKFLFIFPLMAVLLLAFRNKMAELTSKKQDLQESIVLQKTIDQFARGEGVGSDKAPGAPAKLQEGARRRSVVPVTDTTPGKTNDSLVIRGWSSSIIGDSLEKPLFVIDGKKMPVGFSLKDFSRAKFNVPEGNNVDFSVVKNKALSVFGEKECRDIVVISTTRKNRFPKGWGGATLSVPDTALNALEYYVDGALYNGEAARKLAHTWNIESIAVGSFKDKITERMRYAVWFSLKKEVGPADSSRTLFLIDTLRTSRAMSKR
ncbi:MAG: M56 family metallopeptidase [Puia sp.]|nr:M56 family metallopeptidase [Puia sp.]